MRIDITDGLLIEGTQHELLELAAEITAAAHGNPDHDGILLTADGIEPITVRLQTPREEHP